MPFNFTLEDMKDPASFSRAVATNQINVTPQGTHAALKTSGATDPTPQKSITAWSYSDILQGAVALKPTGITLDTFNQSLSRDLTDILNNEGTQEELLGGRQAFAPWDVVERGKFGQSRGSSENPMAASAGEALGTTGNYGEAPPGGYRGTTEMRNIWGNKCMPSGSGATFKPYPGTMTYTVRKETLPVWEVVNSIFQKWNYKIHGSGGGGFNCRAITGGSGLSLHAFGIAIDVNPEQNPYGPKLITDMPSEMIAEIEAIKSKNGVLAVRWGGRYGKNKDAMHFEVMLSPTELAQGLARY